MERQHIRQQQEHLVVKNAQDVQHVTQQQVFAQDAMQDMDIQMENVHHVPQEHSQKEVNQVVQHAMHHV